MSLFLRVQTLRNELSSSSGKQIQFAKEKHEIAFEKFQIETERQLKAEHLGFKQKVEDQLKLDQSKTQL